MKKTLYTGFYVTLLLFCFSSCTKEDTPPDVHSAEYQQAVSDFYMSLAASQTDEARFAFNKMNDVAQAFPKETAAWANLAVYALRQGNMELADDRISRARDRNPENADVLFLSSLIESRRGNISESIQYLQQAVQADPENIRVGFALARELERQDDSANAEEILKRLEQIREKDPGNQVVLMELARISAKENDPESVRRYLGLLSEETDRWNRQNREQLLYIYELLESDDFSSLLLELAFLRSGLEPLPGFQHDLLKVELPPTDVGYLITRFLWLPEPEIMVPEPDMNLVFEKEIPELPVQTAQWLRGVTLLEDLPPFPVAVQNNSVIIDDENRLAFPGDTNDLLPVYAFTEIDFNYNFRNDIALAGSTGFKLYRQEEDGTFTDVTPQLGLPEQVTQQSYYGLWAADVEMDGDLDLIMAPSGGTPFVLRNNGDNTFTAVSPFGETGEVKEFYWADLDGDGVPEAVFITREGELIVAKNLRGGRFTQGDMLADGVLAAAIADINANGNFDIVTLSESGEIEQHFIQQRTAQWQRVTILESDRIPDEPATLFSADIDNNGALDLLISTPSETELWLADSNFSFRRLEEPLTGNITSVFDVNGNERLDLLGITEEMEPFYLTNSGTKDYFARSVRARASGTEGDQRINSFGIGGEMEVRSGLLYQKQLISSPIVHFGLGNYEEADMLRIIWPNGSVQAEFAELGMGATIFNEQILKGSCPWLFTHDGDNIHFITDILWRSPLGLRINARETAGVIQTLDRVKIPGDKLNAVDGIYDLRVTAELWETHFFDHISLVAVDHPADTEIFVDERFVFPAPDLSTRVMSTPAPVSKVTDQTGRDLTSIVASVDENYVQPFQKTAYQGLAEKHYIEIEIGNEAPAGRPLWLILTGWLRPTDSSINLALSQGSHKAPRGLEIRIPDGNGGWQVLHEDYGIPAGKLKSILLDLEGVFEGLDERKIRLYTTSEIYWDAIQWAEKPESSELKETILEARTMELRYRGFSEWNRADSTSPKLPDYSEISGTAQRWQDLTGFHTRFGDVSELLAEIDDRYVIMNAGDEMVFEFEAPELPGKDWKRSFVFVSDGWVKDGDYNTEASATVWPLPFHGQADYDYSAGGSFTDDPVYQKHRKDWIHYHTRYITPETFRSAFLLQR